MRIVLVCSGRSSGWGTLHWNWNAPVLIWANFSTHPRFSLVMSNQMCLAFPLRLYLISKLENWRSYCKILSNDSKMFTDEMYGSIIRAAPSVRWKFPKLTPRLLRQNATTDSFLVHFDYLGPRGCWWDCGRAPHNVRVLASEIWSTHLVWIFYPKNGIRRCWRFKKSCNKGFWCWSLMGSPIYYEWWDNNNRVWCKRRGGSCRKDIY